jgi:hypothetical protein
MAEPAPKNNELTAPARLALLLPWLNGDRLTFEDIRERVWRFLAPPTPTDPTRPSLADAGHTSVDLEPALRELYGSQRLARTIPAVSPSLLARLRTELRQALDGQKIPLRMRFAIREVRSRASVKLSTLTAAERRAHLGPGRYFVAVEGSGLRDTLVYVFMRLLTAPGVATLAKCPAPRAKHAAEACGRWFVATGQRRGQPRKFCSDVCRVRKYQQENPTPRGARLDRRKKR